jgi:hypothetical protein
VNIFGIMFSQRCVGVRPASAVADVEGRDIAVRMRGRDAGAAARWPLGSGRRRVVKFSPSNSEIAESVIIRSDG